MIHNELHQDPDQTSSGAKGRLIRCPCCRRILTQILAVNGESRHRVYCRTCKKYFILDSWGKIEHNVGWSSGSSTGS